MDDKMDKLGKLIRKRKYRKVNEKNGNVEKVNYKIEMKKNRQLSKLNMTLSKMNDKMEMWKGIGQNENAGKTNN